MPFTGKVGDTLYLTDSGGRHRYVILTEPNDDGEVVIVNFTSTRFWKDNSAVFHPRDDNHLFEVETSVRFSDASLVPIEELKEIASSRNNKRKYHYCSENNVKRIIKGAFESEFTVNEILEELKSYYPEEYEKYYKNEDVS